MLLGAVGLGLAWLFGAVALNAPGRAELRARRAALGDPAQPQRRAAARRARSSTPSTGSTRRRRSPARPPASARPNPGSPAIPKCARPATASSACSAPPAAWASRARAGSRGPAWSSPTPTWSPARTTRRSTTQDGDSARRDRRSTTTRRTTSRCCASTPRRPPLPLADRCRERHRRRRPRLSGERALRDLAGPPRRAPARWSARTPTAAARSARQITSLRGNVRSGNSGGPMVDGAGGSSARSSRRRPAARRAASPCRTRSSGGRWREGARRRGRHRPLHGLTDRAGHLRSVSSASRVSEEPVTQPLPRVRRGPGRERRVDGDRLPALPRRRSS